MVFAPAAAASACLTLVQLLLQFNTRNQLHDKMGEFTFFIFFHSCRLLHFLSCIRELQKKNFINSPSRNRPGRLGVLNRKKPPIGTHWPEGWKNCPGKTQNRTTKNNKKQQIKHWEKNALEKTKQSTTTNHRKGEKKSQNNWKKKNKNNNSK